MDLNWDLTNLFTLSDIDGIDADLKKLQFSDLKKDVLLLQDIEMRLQQAQSYVQCLLAQNVNDKDAAQLEARINELSAGCAIASDTLGAALLNVEDLSGFGELAFSLNERKELSKSKLPLVEEKLIQDLSVDGYHAWWSLYNSLVGKMELEFEGKKFSLAQAENMLYSPDRKVRAGIFQKWEEVWTANEDLFASALNHLGGFRLKTYENRKWNDILQEPLFYNRMRAETLNAMWQAVDETKSICVDYLKRKAELLNVDKLSWHDVDASIAGTSQKEYTYEEAKQFVLDQFQSFHPKMADFAKQAFDKRWIEAEDRPNKSTGAFCAPFRKTKESRIYMTFSGTSNCVLTLAHELGHAYHEYQVKDLPFMDQEYRMNVAETASTLAEKVLMDSNEKDSSQTEEQAQRAVTFLMDIQARFLFEMEFYKQRKKGVLQPQQLSQLMLEAQKKAFGDALGEWHPHFWASKRHFYFTGVPFYNFPYTFGYLFSLGIFARAKAEGPSFANKYDALLRDTGRMDVETLAKKYLDVDLTAPHFWREALAIANKDIQEAMPTSFKIL